MTDYDNGMRVSTCARSIRLNEEQMKMANKLNLTHRQIARQIASFPQAAMRGDRMSAYEQYDLPFDEAIQNELEHGRRALKDEAVQGAIAFVNRKHKS